MEELTPRERVLLALAHKETDRVPVDFLATRETWTALQGHLGFHNDEAVLRHLGIDLRHPRQRYIGPPPRQHDDGSRTDPWGVRRRCVPHEGGVYEEIVAHPLAGLGDAAELKDYPWPQPEWWDATSIRDQIRQLEGEGPYGIALEEFGDPGGIFEIAWYLRGMEQFFIDLIERPDLVHEIMTRVTDFYLGMLEQVMAAAGDRIDLIWTSDDIAHQHGPLISKKVWGDLITPHHVRLNKRIHELGARVMYHSCGSVQTFIPGLIQAGVDVLDVLQFSADGMDPEEIKSAYGDRLSFHGGMDVQVVLPRGSAEEVRQSARKLIAVMGRDGGYILSPTHNVQVDTPPENIVAMYQAAGSLRD